MKWSWNFFFHGFPLHIKQTRTNTPEKFTTTTPDQQIEWEWIWREWDRMWKSRKKNSLGCLCLILVLVRQNRKKKTDRPNHTPCTMCTFNIKKKKNTRWDNGKEAMALSWFFFSFSICRNCRLLVSCSRPIDYKTNIKPRRKTKNFHVPDIFSFLLIIPCVCLCATPTNSICMDYVPMLSSVKILIIIIWNILHIGIFFFLFIK